MTRLHSKRSVRLGILAWGRTLSCIRLNHLKTGENLVVLAVERVERSAAGQCHHRSECFQVCSRRVRANVGVSGRSSRLRHIPKKSDVRRSPNVQWRAGGDSVGANTTMISVEPAGTSSGTRRVSVRSGVTVVLSLTRCIIFSSSSMLPQIGGYSNASARGREDAPSGVQHLLQRTAWRATLVIFVCLRQLAMLQ